MKTSLKSSVYLLVLLTGLIIFSANASAQIAPFLTTDGNYTYTDLGGGTGSLTFSSVNPVWASYTNGQQGCNYDPTWDDWSGDACQWQDDIIGNNYAINSAVSFGNLFNDRTSDPFIFGPTAGSTGPVSFSIFEISTGNNFFTATLDDFVITESPSGLSTELAWGALSNIVVGTAPNSRYVTELLANGNGVGNVKITFNPDAGGKELFTSTSSGSVGVIVAAPEPISAVLFITGGATLALRRFRRKRS